MYMEPFERCPDGGKVCFPKRNAQEKKNDLERMGRGKFRLYQCPACNFWHLTSELRRFSDWQPSKKNKKWRR